MEVATPRPITRSARPRNTIWSQSRPQGEFVARPISVCAVEFVSSVEKVSSQEHYIHTEYPGNEVYLLFDLHAVERSFKIGYSMQ